MKKTCPTTKQKHDILCSKSRGRGINNINSRETCFRHVGQETSPRNIQYGAGSLNNKSFQTENKKRNNIESCQISDRNYHTTLNGGTIRINL